VCDCKLCKITLTAKSDDIPEPYLDAWRAFLNAHAAAIERTEQALSGAGLPPLSWYDALWPLYRAPERKLRMGELSQQVVTISRSGLTRLVDRLEASGLVRREPTPADRRGTVVAITREGSSLLRRMWPVYAAEIRRSFVDTLEEKDALALRDLLGRVHAAGDRH
jgi:DNA-binding MarR family transcriptional regulator